MTQPHIDAGDLVVLGLVQEQHPERAQLYAQWHQLDWPILWDPFNTTGATAVPNAYLIDEHGVLQGKRLNADALAAFVEAEFEAPPEPAPASRHADLLYQFQELYRSNDSLDSVGRLIYWQLQADVMWEREEKVASSVRLLSQYLENSEPAAIDYFRLGVLYRMRHDSEHRQPGDFQHAIDAWAEALERDPNQYIWRRRIQQYGPMSDKPYPFYDWVATAQREIRERGETPVEVPQPLTQAELGTGGDAGGSALVPEGEPVNPDPDGRVTEDDGYITVTAATTPDTRRPGHRRVLIEFNTSGRDSEGDSGGDSGGGHWNNEAEPLTVWIDADALPDGWSVESPLLVHAPAPGSEEGDAPAATSDEPRIIDFGLTHPADASGTFTLTGYALYNVCEQGDLGRCLYRRQAFEVVVELE